MIQTEVVTEASINSIVSQVNALVNESCISLITAGQILIALKTQHGHGGFSRLFGPGMLKIDLRLAERLMQVARNAAFTNAANYPFLPYAQNAIFTLAKLDSSQLQQAIDSKEIYPEMTIREVRLLVVSKLAPKKEVSGSSSEQLEDEPQIEIHEPDPYDSIIAIIEDARSRFSPEAMFELRHRLAEYFENISPDENDSPSEECD